MVFLEKFRGAAVVGQMNGRAIGNGCTALHPGWRLVELALPWAKVYNPYRVEFVPTPTPPATGGGTAFFDWGIPWWIRAAMGRGARPGHRDPM